MRSIWQNRRLVGQLTRREITQRYKNSALGGVWVLGQPVIQLLLYSFVFGLVLQSRWGSAPNGGAQVPFGLMLFVGLLLHSVLADTLVRGPGLVSSQHSFVKRVVFPLEVLPLVNVLAGLLSLAVGFAVLVVASAVVLGHIPACAPLVVLPVASLAVMCAGFGWILSSTGLYLRDLSQITSHLATIFLFTAPVCYPREVVPQRFGWLLSLNPLTQPLEATRALLFGTPVNWEGLGGYCVVAVLVAALGWRVFGRLREGFADVI